MTNGSACERARSPTRATCASSAVVTESVTPVVVSVFSRTRPSPGKCLSVAVTPDRAKPSITVPAAGDTLSGVLPYWRPKAPRGVLAVGGADGRMGGLRAGRDDIGYGREVEVQAGVVECRAHAVGQRGEVAGRQGALVQRRGQPLEAGPLKRLDGAAFLVRRQPEARPGGQGLPPLGGRGQLGGRRLGPPGEEQPAHAALGRRVAGAEVVERDTHDEQLADPRSSAEPGQDRRGPILGPRGPAGGRRGGGCRGLGRGRGPAR